MLYFIADTHFGDPKIIPYKHRPFASLDDMTEKMIVNWNNVVKDDIVFVLGDLSFYDLEHTKDIVNRLNGTKFIIKGNHDIFSIDEYKSCGFIDVFEDTRDFNIEDEQNPTLILSHKPEDTEYFNIHGHIHDDPLEKSYPNLNKKNHFCVSVEMTDYKPISWEEIKNKIKGDNKDDKF